MPRRSMVGVSTWVFVLAALSSSALAGDPRVSTSEVMREGLRLSKGEASVYLSHVKKALVQLEEDGLVEHGDALRGSTRVVFWWLTPKGENRWAELAGAFRELGNIERPPPQLKAVFRREGA